jgi:hypothetical protein
MCLTHLIKRTSVINELNGLTTFQTLGERAWKPEALDWPNVPFFPHQRKRGSLSLSIQLFYSGLTPGLRRAELITIPINPQLTLVATLLINNQPANNFMFMLPN